MHWTFARSRHDGATSILARARRTLAALAVVGLAFVGTPDGFAQTQQDDRWVATWGASPQSAAEPFSGPPPTPVQFNNQTVRTIARISKGGDQVRVRLSNELGTEPLLIGAARVAVHAFGSSIVASTDRVLAFGGSSSIRIPPGAAVLSDPATLSVPDLAQLAVSVHLPSATSGLTVHSLGRQTTYISPAGGDLTGAITIPTPTTTQVRHFVTGIDVRSDDQRTVAIVTLGDSITDGFNATVDANRRWPDRLAERLLDRRNPRRLAVVNAGISGNRILNNVIGPNALSRFDRDVLAQTGAEFVVVLEGINDIGFSAIAGGAFASQEVSAEQIIQGYRQLIARAHAKGLRIVGGTLTPFEGASYFTAQGETKRQTVNNFIRSSGEFDDFIDFDLATRDPSQPTRLLPLYDSGDHLHPNDTGYRAMGDAVDLSIFRLRQGSGALSAASAQPPR